MSTSTGNEQSRVLTLVFTDLADSTALKTERGDVAVGELIARHRDVVTRLAGECAGRIIDWAGDGCFLTFETSSAGVLFALRLQQAHAEDADLPGVRAGIHMGEVTESTDAEGRTDVNGLAVDLASRVCGLAKPGQVLMSSAVYDSARQRIGVEALGKPILWQAHGTYALKGFDKAVEIGEAGLEGFALLEAPRAGDKARLVRRAKQARIKPRNGERPRSPRWAYGAIVVLVAALGVFVSRNALEPAATDKTFVGGTVETPRITSIAVLPFTNMMNDPGQDYFTDGMTEALITELSKIEALKVISRTSVMRYKTTNLSTPEIAAELGVDGIVEGSVLKEGDTVRITAQLVHGPSDTHRWAGSFDRALTSVLKLHSEMALAIAEEVRANLTPGERARLASAPEVNPRAYELYIEGRALWSERTPEGFEGARERFDAALELDPEFALAYAGLADVYAMLGEYVILGGAEALKQGLANVEKALEIDPNLSEAYAARAFLRAQYEWDWVGAESDFQRALELNPSNASAHQLYGTLLDTMNRKRDAMAQLEEALELDPFSPIIVSWHLELLSETGTSEETLARATEVRREFADSARVHNSLEWAYWEIGQREDAAWASARAYELGADDLNYRLIRACDLAEYGRHEESRELLEDLIPDVRRVQRGFDIIASTYGHLGEIDEAVAWMKLAIEHRDAAVVVAKIDGHRLWYHLQDEPRFQAIVDEIEVPDSWGRN